MKSKENEFLSCLLFLENGLQYTFPQPHMAFNPEMVIKSLLLKSKCKQPINDKTPNHYGYLLKEVCKIYFVENSAVTYLIE